MIELVKSKRIIMPKIGTRKLYYLLKEDLKEFKALETICKIKVYNYTWKDDPSDFRDQGILAHELDELIPQAVSGEKDGEEYQAVDYSKIVPLLVKSIQELTAKVESLEADMLNCKN